MPFKIPHHTVQVQRGGTTVAPPVGVPFNFTKEEIAEVRAHNEFALRDPVNEGGTRVMAVNETELLQGKAMPSDVDTVRDANLVEKMPAKAGGAARMQGGSKEDGKVARGGKSLAQEEEEDDETL